MNLNQTFAILFWLKKTKMNKQGLAPIWVRITVDRERAEFSTQKQIYPGYWDAENKLALKEFSEAKTTNDFLTLVKADILRHYNMLISTKEVVTAVDVENSYKGIKVINRTLLQLFRQYNQQLSERKEINDLSEGRYKRFQILYGKFFC